MIGDVAGKGVPAALLMAKVSSDARFCALTEPTLTAAIEQTQRTHAGGRPARSLRHLRRLRARSQRAQAHLVNAGHPAAVDLSAATQAYEDGCTTDQTGLPLGIIEGIDYECNTFALAPGDCVVLYTDGVSESQKPRRQGLRHEGHSRGLERQPEIAQADGHRLVEAVRCDGPQAAR